MTKKVYIAQRIKPARKDFYLTVSEEKQKYKIELSDAGIQTMSKGKFKNIVNEKVEKFAYNSLMETVKTQSK